MPTKKISHEESIELRLKYDDSPEHQVRVTRLDEIRYKVVVTLTGTGQVVEEAEFIYVKPKEL